MAILVGNTPLLPNPDVSGRCNFAKVLVKNEGIRECNPSGTFKDRRNAAILRLYEDRKHVVFVSITYGNSGYSLAMLAQEEQRRTGRRIDVVNVIPTWISPEIERVLGTCSFVHKMDLDKEYVSDERLRKIARQITGFTGPEDDIRGVEGYSIKDGYARIITEIHESGILPTKIFCPVGGGELLTELALEAGRVWGPEAPLIVGVTIPGNALLSDEEFIPTARVSIADKLTNPCSEFRELVRSLIRDGRVHLFTVGDREIFLEYEFLKRKGINAEPSAAVAFRGAEVYKLSSSDTIVIVNTGSGIYDHGRKPKTTSFPRPEVSPEAREELGRKLMLAAEKDDGDEIRKLIRMGGDPNYSCVTYAHSSSVLTKCEHGDERVRSVLQVACFSGSEKAVEALLDWDAGVDARIFATACKKGNPYIIDMLIDAGADVNGGYDGRSFLRVAIKSQNLLAIKSLLEHGADPREALDVIDMSDTARTSRLIRIPFLEDLIHILKHFGMHSG